jgi:hypothetical protein
MEGLRMACVTATCRLFEYTIYFRVKININYLMELSKLIKCLCCHSGVVRDSVSVEYETVSLCNRFPMLSMHFLTSKSRKQNPNDTASCPRGTGSLHKYFWVPIISFSIFVRRNLGPGAKESSKNIKPGPNLNTDAPCKKVLWDVSTSECATAEGVIHLSYG